MLLKVRARNDQFPVVSRPDFGCRWLVAATGRSKPAVNQAMQQLCAAGVLEQVSASPRNRAWEAHGLLDLLAGLDAGR